MPASSSTRAWRRPPRTTISTTRSKATSTWKRGAHTLGTGFYLGDYRVIADDNSLVFPGRPHHRRADERHAGLGRQQRPRHQHRLGPLRQRSLADRRPAARQSRLALGRSHRLHRPHPDRSHRQSLLSPHPRHDAPWRRRPLHAGAELSGHLSDRLGRFRRHHGRRSRRRRHAADRGRLRSGCRRRPSPQPRGSPSPRTITTRSRTTISTPDSSASCRFSPRSTTRTAISGAASSR